MPKMPANNRVSGSVALKTNDIWSKTIGHDPYASSTDAAASSSAGQLEGIKLLAKLQNAGSGARGGCQRCGLLGHLTYQCRNDPIAAAKGGDSDDTSSSDSSADEPVSAKVASSDRATKTTSSSKRKLDESDEEEKKKSKKHKSEKKHKVGNLPWMNGTLVDIHLCA
jgi:Zinc knuckle